MNFNLRVAYGQALSPASIRCLRSGYADLATPIRKEIVTRAEHAERQPDGRWRFWGYVPERALYLRVVTLYDKETLHNPMWNENFTRKRAGSGEKQKRGESVRITYFPDTDSLSIDLKDDYEGPGYGEDLTPDGAITAHYSAARELVSIEIEAGASKHIDLSHLEIEGLPISASQTIHQESKAG